jgi:hypothetical protein
MPTDKAGKYHFNTQRAMAADKYGASKTKPTKAEPAVDGGNPQHEAKDDGDVKSHLEALHAATGGKHLHVHDDGLGSITSHHIGEDGEVQGPHSHENLEALKQHMDQFLDEEGHEGSGSGDSDENVASYHDLSGL